MKKKTVLKIAMIFLVLTMLGGCFETKDDAAKIERIGFDKSTVEIPIYQPNDLTCIAIYSDGKFDNLSQFTLISSNPEIVEISSSGKQIIGIKEGTTIVSAVSEGVSGSINVKVVKNVNDKIFISASSKKVKSNNTDTIVISGKIQHGSDSTYTDIAGKHIECFANGVKTTDNNFKTSKKGIYTVTARAFGIEGTPAVEVLAYDTTTPTAIEVQISKSTIKNDGKDACTFSAIITDKDGTVLTGYSQVKYYINGVLTTQTSIVSGVEGEKFKIKAEFFDFASSEKEVTVIKSVSGLTISAPSTYVVVGKNVTLSAVIVPDTAADKNIVWTSSDVTLATVTDGVVKGIKAGNVTITGKIGAIVSTCVLNVIEEKDEAYLKIKLSVEAAVKAYEDAANELLTTQAEIDAAKAKANIDLSKLNTTDKAYYEGIIKSITDRLDAMVIYVTDISLNVTTATVEVGGTITLTAEITPFDATDKSIIWTSADSTVAQVANGKVTGAAVGMTKITVSTKNGKSAECLINVIAKNTTPITTSEFKYKGKGDLFGIAVNYYDVKIVVSNTNVTKVTAYSYPSNQNIKEIDISSGTGTLAETMIPNSVKTLSLVCYDINGKVIGGEKIVELSGN